MDGEIARHDDPNFTASIEPKWHDGFDERQLRLIENCLNYALNDPAGLPGHQLMLIIAKLVSKLIDAEMVQAMFVKGASDTW